MKAAVWIVSVVVIPWAETHGGALKRAPQVQVRVDASKRASYPIPPTIFGTFLEPAACDYSYHTSVQLSGDQLEFTFRGRA
jgi:hypothetical protein